MECPDCKIQMEEGTLNYGRNWSKGSPFGRVLPTYLGFGKPVTALCCPNCGQIKFYTLENLSNKA